MSEAPPPPSTPWPPAPPPPPLAVEAAGPEFAAGPRPPTWLFPSLLTAVFLLGSVLRFWGLEARGLLLYDEAVHLLEARWMLGVLASVPDAFRLASLGGIGDPPPAPAPVPPTPPEPTSPKRLQAQALSARMSARLGGGLAPIWCRPTHDLLIALAMTLVGDRDSAGLLVSAAFGSLSVLFVGLLARRLWGPTAGLLGALALALSPLHLLHSRNALAEADSTFYLLAAVTLLGWALTSARRPVRWVFVAGLLTGVCYTANVRLVVAPLILWSGYALGCRSSPTLPPRDRLRGALWLSLGMAVPLGLWELSYVSAHLLLDLPWYRMPESYFRRVLWYIPNQGTRDAGFGEFSALPYFLWLYEGPLLLPAAAAGLLLALRRRSLPDLFLLAVPLWTYGFYLSRAVEQPLRYLVLPLPALALAVGSLFAVSPPLAGLPPAAERIRRSRWLPAAVAATLLLLGLTSLGEPLLSRSAYPAACAWLGERRAAGDAPFYFMRWQPIGWYYDRSQRWATQFPDRGEDLERLYKAGVRYLVVDPPVRGLSSLPTEYGDDLLRRLEARCHPKEFPHPGGAMPNMAFEHHRFVTPNLDSTLLLAEAMLEHGGTVRVYDLSEFFGPAPWPPR
ncbi:MAG: glycosyltransferase family 39 protein [Planctomycetes bacterium]|nr:glycosyltransferase family 39 protein [Planctomycetota bacterium]